MIVENETFITKKVATRRPPENSVSNSTATILAISKVCCCANTIPGGRMYTQRKKERRDLGGKTSFPLVTNSGYEIEKDRRSNPDRRLGNIHLELLDVVNREFSECSTKTPSYSEPD